MTMVALDILLDDPEKLRSEVQAGILRLNSALESKLTDLMEYAGRFLGKIQDGARTELLPGINEQIKTVLAANLPDGIPMLDPMRGAWMLFRSRSIPPSSMQHVVEEGVTATLTYMKPCGGRCWRRNCMDYTADPQGSSKTEFLDCGRQLQLGQ
ncbi:MAG: hypothetical protein IPG42_01335 [Betaproteobacteria bacterium]|nr:hypothetical protein [Betaproteobacteria bacterium]